MRGVTILSINQRENIDSANFSPMMRNKSI